MSERDDSVKTDKDLSQRERIERLRERINDLIDGEMTEPTNDALDPDVLEQYLENVVMIEESGWAVPADRLREGGLELPPADQLDDEELQGKLRELVHAMAFRNMYVTSTDHLSDRELYTYLESAGLKEEGMLGPATPVPGFAYVIDILGSGSEEDMYLHHKYYADDESRQHWLEQRPDTEMPDREKRPYDRDRFLPQPDFSLPEAGNESDQLLM